MASKPPDTHLPGCRWAWDGSPCLCPGGDIPEQNQVVVVTPYHREYLSEEAAASWRELMKSTRPVELDPLHPTGRCTCGGEGDCDWCMSHCVHCGSSVWPHDEGEAFDYEALGYPETEDCDYISAGGLDTLAETIDLVLGSVLGDISERIAKRYPSRQGYR